MYIMYMKEIKKLAFWERTKKLIRAHNISQKDLAAHIGISYSSFRYCLCYGSYPDVKTAHDISVALGVSIEYLLTGVDDRAMRIREKETFKRKTTAAGIIKMGRKIGK